MRYFEIMETAWGISKVDARELLFPTARKTWLLTVRNDGNVPASECQTRLLGEPPFLYVAAGGWVKPAGEVTSEAVKVESPC